MKCPKCKKEMDELNNGFGRETNEIACFNPTCDFYGIERILGKREK